jgi:signal peptidase II
MPIMRIDANDTNGMRMIRIKYFGLNCLILFLFVVDRIFKYYFLKNPVIYFGGDFLFGFGLHFEKNFGVAFGILINQIILLVLVALIILILISLALKAYSRKDFYEISGLSLIVIGAVSNLIDRLRYGFVIDYIDFPYFTVFNLADFMITFGVVILLAAIFKKEKTSQAAG